MGVLVGKPVFDGTPLGIKDEKEGQSETEGFIEGRSLGIFEDEGSLEGSETGAVFNDGCGEGSIGGIVSCVVG